MTDRTELTNALPWSNPIGGTLDVGDGWLPIIEKLHKQIAEVAPDYKVAQVKEKFGGLRYYTADVDYPTIVDFIRAAEAESAATCEECGNAGRAQSVSRYLTLILCDADAARLREERRF